MRHSWGDGVIRSEAERHFVQGDPPPELDIRTVTSPLSDDVLGPLRARNTRVQFPSVPTDAELQRLDRWIEEHPDVVFRVYELRDGSIRDLEFLVHLPHVRRLVVELLGLTTLDGLRHLLADLEYLIIGETTARMDLRSLVRFTALKFLSIGGSPKSIESLGRLVTLESLGLGVKTLADLSPLLPLVHLRELSLESTGAAAPALEELVIDDARQLEPERFHCLSDHPTLRAASIRLGSVGKTKAVSEMLGLPVVPDPTPW